MDLADLLSRRTSMFEAPALRRITLEVEKVRGINLGQGVCNLPPPPELIEAAQAAIVGGMNRYTNPRGLASFREAIGTKLEAFNGIHADPHRNILATCGATGAFEAVCGALLNPGDEVVVFEPTYPYHVQALKRYGAQIVVHPLAAPTWEIDLSRLRTSLSSRTKFLLLNTPGNPTGKVFDVRELEALAEVMAPTRALLVTDEIYESMTFDGRTHVSPASLIGLRDRTITIGGYSKTFAVTGWRIGYMVAPEPLADSMTAFLDAVYVCPPAPLQQAVADTVRLLDSPFYAGLSAKYQRKRDRFHAGLLNLGLEPLLPQGAYYMICRFDGRFPGMSSQEFALRLIHETGVGAVPSSDFVREAQQAPWVRFCLAQEDEMLDQALDRLRSLS